MVRHALEEVRRGPNEASRKMMRYWHAQREREVQRDSGGRPTGHLWWGGNEPTWVVGKIMTNMEAPIYISQAAGGAQDD